MHVRNSMCPIRCLSLVAVLWFVGSAPVAAQPRLAVVVIVDQMPVRYLSEFAADFHGGFARLLENGAVMENAYHDHALTETSPGNSTIVTGVFPSRHAVVGNDIWDRELGKLLNAVIDPRTAMVGATRQSGRSPWRLQRTTVGDWLKATSPESLVFGVSLKDRTAVFTAGQNPNGAYWYDERAGNFATSDFYRSDLPSWVDAFNAERRVDAYYDTSWTRLAPSDRVEHAAPSPGLAAADYPPFPHLLTGDADVPDRRFFARFRLTPFADLLTLDFARALIEAERLGADSAPDILFVGLSASDYIGHRYGPQSDEVHEHYLRLDGYLGDFLNYLDERFGHDNYIIVLSSDHGVLTVPERTAAEGTSAARIHWDVLLDELAPVVDDAYRRGIISSVPKLRYEYGVIFDFGEADVPRAQSDALADIVAAQLNRHPFVLKAYTHRELREGRDDGSPWFELYLHSFVASRAPDVVVHVRENHLITDRAVGTTHVSPHEYDRHVPLIFAGAAIGAARYREFVRTVDVAPTLATLLEIEAPSDLDGHDISRIIRAAD